MGCGMNGGSFLCLCKETRENTSYCVGWTRGRLPGVFLGFGHKVTPSQPSRTSPAARASPIVRPRELRGVGYESGTVNSITRVGH